MNISKLKYVDKKAALKDLKAKGVYNDDLSFGDGIHAVVEIGIITLTDGTYDEEGNEITPPVFAEGYHYDIMSETKINFKDNETLPSNPKHEFL
jgi:hypothetical protein